MRVRFSDHFRLSKSQAELDFVDIPLGTDIPLFVDPYALSIDRSPWFAECSDTVVDFFQRLIDTIRAGDRERGGRMLLNLHEPNETHLGFSRKRPAGRGIGRIQADQLFSAFVESRAVETGMLKDLADCELLIPGISSDKISDITINIIRGKLIEYTQSQCSLFGVPTESVPMDPQWDPNTGNWVSRYAELPRYRGRTIVLVPKAAVRYRLALDHRDYYWNFVLNFLRAEHLEAGDALVTVLKNRKRVVHKKRLKEKYPCSKPFLLEFSVEHPQTLDDYKGSRITATAPLEDESIEAVQPIPRPIDRIALVGELESIRPGHSDYSKYHNFIARALEAIFYPLLHKPEKEREIHEGRKRIDIVFNNGYQGFFADLVRLHKVPCPYILFECKNYQEDPENPELDQLTGRFSGKRGEFGILVCRLVGNRAKMLANCRDILQDDRGYVLVLDDSDIKALLELRAQGDFAGLSNYLDDMYRQLLF